MPSLGRGGRARLREQLVASQERSATFRAERDVMRLRVNEMKRSERSVVGELSRLRELTFGRDDREPPDAMPSYLFVVSCGRTGSTLVQGILNSTPGVLVRGENGGVMTDLFHLHKTASRHRERLVRDDRLLKSRHPWWGIDGYPNDLALREFRHLATDLLLRPESDVHTVGFKEVKWPVGRVAEYIRFLREVFPGARFILSSRRLEDVAASGWWANRPDAMSELVPLDAELRASVEDLGPAGYEARYDDFADDPEGLQPMFDWLGFAFRPDVVAAVMSRPHSYDRAEPEDIGADTGTG